MVVCVQGLPRFLVVPGLEATGGAPVVLYHKACTAHQSFPLVDAVRTVQFPDRLQPGQATPVARET